MILFFAYYINQYFNDPTLNNNVTFSSLNTIMGTFTFSQQINTNLVFGDFISVFTLLGGLMTGSVFTSAMTIVQNSGFADASVSLLMGLLFDSGTVFLLMYIVSFRSI